MFASTKRQSPLYSSVSLNLSQVGGQSMKNLISKELKIPDEQLFKGVSSFAVC